MPKNMEESMALRGEGSYLRPHSRKMERLRLEPTSPDP